MLIPLLVAALAVPQQQQAAPPIPQRQTVVRDSTPPDTTKDREAGRRLPVTADLLATAFKNSQTRTLFQMARKARLEQDSAIKSYDAMARQRLSANLGIGIIGREHLMFRRESSARVQWQHDVGAVVELTGARAGIPIAPKVAEVEASLEDLNFVSPIPYYPGSESLWIMDESSARVEANDREIVNPLTVGAEAYYTYAIADSVSFTLADGTKINLREIEVRPRQPKWNLAVGSFWFDDKGRLVKCAYRLAVPLDIWQMVEEEADSSDQVPGAVKAFLSPMRAQITGIAIEYSLMHGRFWLPSMRSMTGFVQVMFAKMPLSIDQRFEYRSVNAPSQLQLFDSTLAKLPLWSGAYQAQRRDSIRAADSTRRGADSTRRAAMTPEARAAERDSIRRRRDSTSASRQAMYKAIADSLERGLPVVGAQAIARNGTPCDSAGYSTRYMRRFATRMAVAVRVPCNLSTLVNSPDLPPSIYDAGEELFSTKQRDDLLKEALTLTDQAPFALGRGMLPKPTYAFGLSMTRYNRVEGLSTGISVDQELGAGLGVGAIARFGLADKVPNVELRARRTNLSKTITVSGYHRLVTANDWGNPLSFGSSFSALMFGKDEGFYYRASGADVQWARGVASKFEWRVFAENQNSAPVKTQTSLVHRSATDTFPSNIAASPGTYIGSGMHIVHNHGVNPRGFRTFSDVRLEAAASDSFYARGSADLNLAMGTPFHTTVGLTLSGGSSLGFLPPQRRWYLGGTHSVRGQDADTTYGGNTYALTRIELARDRRTHRTSLFGDVGWAGDRNHLALDGRLLSGVGIGQSMMDGIIRMDLARGLQPKRQWRFDVYLEARF